MTRYDFCVSARLTGFGENLDPGSVRGSGVSGVLQKPFRGRELADAVDRAIERAPGEPARGSARDRLVGPMP